MPIFASASRQPGSGRADGIAPYGPGSGQYIQAAFFGVAQAYHIATVQHDWLSLAYAMKAGKELQQGSNVARPV